MTDSAQKGLRRDDAAKFLKDHIGECAPMASTMARMASEGRGPKFYKFGRYPVYMPSDLLEWAYARIKPAQKNLVETSAEEPK